MISGNLWSLEWNTKSKIDDYNLLICGLGIYFLQGHEVMSNDPYIKRQFLDFLMKKIYILVLKITEGNEHRVTLLSWEKAVFIN